MPARYGVIGRRKATSLPAPSSLYRLVPERLTARGRVLGRMTDFDAIAQGMTQAVPFAGHLGLEITSIAEGEAVVRPAGAPGADQPRRLPARRRPLHGGRDGLGRGLRRRLRRAARRGDAAGAQRRDLLREDRQGADRGERQARHAGGGGARHPRRRGQGRVPLRGRADRRLRHAGRDARRCTGTCG